MPVDETTLILGQLSGTWKDVYDRQDTLYAAQVAAVLAAWRKLTADLDVAAMVALFRREAYMTSDGSPAPATDGAVAAHRKTELRTLAAALTAGMLAGTADSLLLAGFLAAITAALTASAGEGYASTLAVAASAAGNDGSFDWDSATADGQQDAGQAVPAEVAAAITAGVASALARALVTLAAEGATATVMVKTLTAALKTAQPLGVVLTHAMASAISASALGVMSQYGVERASWITAGDAKVCPVCESYEAHGPYPVDEMPACPDHFGCRCVIVPDGRTPLPADAYSAYLAA
ncbi:MAG: hypothetical protein ABSH19_10095 [Opitutales bacterium]